MDPNQALEGAREAYAAALEAEKNADSDLIDFLQSAVESYQALDEWPSRGGFLPTAWTTRPRTPLSNVNRARWQA